MRKQSIGSKSNMHPVRKKCLNPRRKTEVDGSLLPLGCGRCSTIYSSPRCLRFRRCVDTDDSQIAVMSVERRKFGVWSRVAEIPLELSGLHSKTYGLPVIGGESFPCYTTHSLSFLVGHGLNVKLELGSQQTVGVRIMGSRISPVLTRKYLQASHVALVRLGNAKDALESNRKMMRRITTATENMDVIMEVVGVVAEVSVFIEESRNYKLMSFDRLTRCQKQS